MDQIKKDDQEDLWGYAKRIRFVRETIAESFPGTPPEQLNILDVGCGNGSQLTTPLAKFGYRITGIDPDQRSIKHAWQLAGNFSNVTFRCATAAEVSREA